MRSILFFGAIVGGFFALQEHPEWLPKGVSPHDVMIWVMLGSVALAALAIYFLPSVIANNRGVAGGEAVFLVNLLFGWTLIGWLICLLWAATGQTKDQAAFYAQARRSGATPQLTPRSP